MLFFFFFKMCVFVFLYYLTYVPFSFQIFAFHITVILRRV